MTFRIGDRVHHRIHPDHKGRILALVMTRKGHTLYKVQWGPNSTGLHPMGDLHGL